MEVAKEGGDGTLAPPEKMAAAIIEILEQKGFLSRERREVRRTGWRELVSTSSAVPRSEPSLCDRSSSNKSPFRPTLEFFF